jgi:hypothetical protein
MSSSDDKISVGLIGCLMLIIPAALIGMVVLPMWGCPHYHVYQQEMAGMAKLKEAESSKQIMMQEAHAKREAAKDLAAAEIERAKGVAEANRIIGEGLKDNHEYLLYLWIHGISENTGREIIYVPTEGGLPILEAGRFSRPAPVEKKK